MEWFFKTGGSWENLFLRLTLGMVMFPHGAQKVLGWYGGGGFLATIHTFSNNLHIPAALTLLVMSAEFLGSIGLVLGLFTRLGAFGILCNMTGAIFLVHLPNGFFMNWFGKQAGEGFEYHLLAIAIALALVIGGGGRFSADGAIYRKKWRY